jgi:hypothetical protein
VHALDSSSQSDEEDPGSSSMRPLSPKVLLQPPANNIALIGNESGQHTEVDLSSTNKLGSGKSKLATERLGMGNIAS